MLTWNLDRLYESFECDSFIKTMEESNSLAQGHSQWVDQLVKHENDIEILESYIDKAAEIRATFAPVYAFSGLSFSADSSNSVALSNIQKIQGMQALMVAGNVVFEKWLVNVSDLDDKIKSSKKLSEHKFFIHQIIEKSKYSLDENTEAIIAQMRNTGSRAFDTLQKKVASAITEKVVIDGEEKDLPLQAIRNLAMERDPAKRIAGYEAEMRAYKKNEEWSAAALNGIKGEALTLSKLRGFKSPLEQTLVNSRMNQETLDAMLDAIKDSLPKFREYYKRKAELLGHKNGLPFYDLLAPMGDADVSFPYEKGQKLVLDQFKTYSQELHDMAKEAFEMNWLDVEPRKGKAGGAFCSPILSLKESRILLNYTGKLNNAITMAHELGHAFHNKNLFGESIVNYGSPMPLAETASIFCETIVKNAALKEANDDELFSILEVAIQGYSQVIVDIYSRFLFETALFENRENGALSPAQFMELMQNAQKESYGDGLDPEFMHPYMWMNKPHYYMPDRDFYNFPYSFGLLFAKGLFAKYKEMGEAFVPRLNNLLSSTGKMDIISVAQLLDVDVTDKAFWQASLNEIAGEIDRFIELSK